MSTSIAEGFGYALYEPWLYGRPVIGRRPQGFSALPGMKARHLYARLPVPAGQVRLPRLVSAYQKRLRAAGVRVPSSKRLEAELVRNGRVDFGTLDQATQWEILGRIARDPSAGNREFAVSLQPFFRQINGFFSSPMARKVISGNRLAIRRALIGTAFHRAFTRCFSSAPRLPAKPRPGLVRSAFGTVAGQRLLLTPPRLVRAKK
ncbi:MAG: hypothetical protein GF418_12190 [Chitinivibrionales bacterium]|nr:hypothetical protein [Chitinivibrionales bacterium]MBD3396378.1 hypothetical protein [Chitinivibrionales bacterium]